VCPRNAVILREKEIQRGLAPRKVQPMSETIPSPEPPSKTIEEETAEFLELLLRIRSHAKEKDE
jgi:hypothetical protein